MKKKSLFLAMMMGMASMSAQTTSTETTTTAATLPLELKHTSEVVEIYGSLYNKYKNYVTLGNGASLKAEDLNADKNAKLTICHFTLGVYEDQEVSPWMSYDFAEVTFSKDENNDNAYTYKVEYYYDPYDEDADAYPATTGSLTVDADGNVDVSGLQVCNIDWEYNRSGTYLYGYRYSAVFVSDGDTVLSGETSVARVNVPSLNVTEPACVTQEQMVTDTICSKRVAIGEPWVSVASSNSDAEVASYGVKIFGTDGWEDLCSAHLTPDGQYKVAQNGKETTFSSGNDVKMGIGELYGESIILAPVANVKCADGSASSYVGEQSTVVNLGLLAEETGKEISNFSFSDANGNVGNYYRSDLKITPLGFFQASGTMYRVWRKTADGDAMEVASDYKIRLQQDTHPVEMSVSYGYDESTGEWNDGLCLSDNCKKEFGSHNAAMESIAPKINEDGSISFTDVIGARQLQGASDELKVTYIVRAYYLKYVYDLDIDLPKAPALVGAKSDIEKSVIVYPPTPPEAGVAKYYVAETTVDVVFDKDVTTSVKEVVDCSGKTPASVRYANMQGVMSDQPFDGLNIVVTTYSDGTTKSEKKIF